MKKSTSKNIKIKPIVLGVSILIIIGLVVLGYMKRTKDQMVNLKTKVIPEVVAKLIGDPTAKINNVANLKLVSGIYEFELNLTIGGKEQKYTSYISKDGKIFFTAGTKVESLKNAPTAQTQAEQKKLTCTDLEKSEKPMIDAFVVADCPFGLQMQRLVNKAVGEQTEFANNIVIKYLGSITDGKITSMHGDKEAQENLKQICIREEQSTLYWPYVSCYMKEGKSDDCSKTAGINTTKLTACTTDATKGLAYAKKDFDLAGKYNIGSSPTLLLNEKQIVSEFDFGGRVVNSLKEIICCSSQTKPGFCTKTLSTDQIASSYSVTEAGSGTGTAAANCGN